MRGEAALEPLWLVVAAMALDDVGASQVEVEEEQSVDVVATPAAVAVVVAAAAVVAAAPAAVVVAAAAAGERVGASVLHFENILLLADVVVLL